MERMTKLLECADCGAPLAITTYPANGYNEWSVVCSRWPQDHAPSVYDWPMEPVPVQAASTATEGKDDE